VHAHTFWWWWWSEALFAGFFFPRFLKYNIAIYSQSESAGKRFSGREHREVCVCVCVEGSMVRAVASLYTHPFAGWEQAQKWMCLYVLFVWCAISCRQSVTFCADIYRVPSVLHFGVRIGEGRKGRKENEGPQAPRQNPYFYYFRAAQACTPTKKKKRERNKTTTDKQTRKSKNAFALLYEIRAPKFQGGEEVPASAVEKQEPRRLAQMIPASASAFGHAGLHDGAFVVMVDGSGRLGVVVLVVGCAWRLLYRGRRLGTA